MNVVVFSGTTEGRELSRQLAALGIEVTVSVATPLGQEEQGSTPGITVRCGRLLPDEMAALLGDAALCIDATHPYAVEATKNIKAAAEKNPIIQGIHLEGPFISVNYKGAQDASYIQKPDAAVLKHWNELSGNRIKIVTYAPEEADTEFEDWCLANGIVPSAGHSNATYDQLCGCRACHVTHLYNAQRGLNHREPGVTGYGLLTDGVKAEMICDGIHIKPKMVYMAYKVKGSDGIELITDSMRAKGMPEGKSELGGQTVYVKDGTARLEDGTIAGSVLTYIDAFRNIMKFTDASLKEAVQMSSGNQAKEFGLTQKGEITVGKDADFVILENSQDGNYELKKTISMGEIIEA